jgi:phospholipase C
VSFLGTLASEHPSGLPAAGAAFLAQVLDALASNEELWNTTVLVIQ